MRRKTVNIRTAKTQLSRLIERGERIIIVRAGKPVAELRPVRRTLKRSVPADDPMLRVDEYSYDGPIGPTTTPDIDSTVYGV